MVSAVRMTSTFFHACRRLLHLKDKQPACPDATVLCQPHWRARGAGCASDKRCGLQVGKRWALPARHARRFAGATLVASGTLLLRPAGVRAQVAAPARPAHPGINVAHAQPSPEPP